MDNTNPLTSLTHKRRFSALGAPGTSPCARRCGGDRTPSARRMQRFRGSAGTVPLWAGLRQADPPRLSRNQGPPEHALRGEGSTRNYPVQTLYLKCLMRIDNFIRSVKHRPPIPRCQCSAEQCPPHKSTARNRPQCRLTWPPHAAGLRENRLSARLTPSRRGPDEPPEKRPIKLVPFPSIPRIPPGCNGSSIKAMKCLIATRVWQYHCAKAASSSSKGT